MPPPVLPKVFVGGLGADVTAAELKEFFKDAEGVVSAIIVRDHQQKSRGFGYVSFRDEASQEMAISEYSGKAVAGRAISVRKFERSMQPGSQRTSAMRSNDSSVFVSGIDLSTTTEQLKDHFASCGNVVKAYIMVDKATGKSRGIGRVVFMNSAERSKAIAELNGSSLDGRVLLVREFGDAPPAPAPKVPWAPVRSASASRGKGMSRGTDNAVFCGGLDYSTTEDSLRAHLSSVGQVDEVKIVIHPETGKSRGFAKVVFSSAEDRERAVRDLHLSELDGRTISVKEYTSGPTSGSAPSSAQASPSRPSEHSVFVGGLSGVTDIDDLRQHFEVCGRIIKVHINMDRETGKSKGFGKVVFSSAAAQIQAIDDLNGSQLDGRTISVREFTTQPTGDQAKARGGAYSVLISGLDPDTGEDVLRDHFCACGEVLHCSVNSAERTGKVKFSSEFARRRALREWNDTELDGRIISVRSEEPELARPFQRDREADRHQAKSAARTRSEDRSQTLWTSSAKRTVEASAPPEPLELKVDPDDGAVYTFQAFKAKKIGHVSDSEIEDYWRFDCTPAPAGARLSDGMLSSISKTAGVERRLDPDDGQLYTFQEFAAKCGREFTPSELEEYWQLDMERLSTAPVSESVSTLHPSAPSSASTASTSQVDQVLQPTGLEDRRIDPEDGKAYNFKDFEIRCKAEGFSTEDIQEYWDHEMEAVEVSAPASPAADVAVSGSLDGPYLKFKHLSLRGWLEAVDVHMLPFLPRLEQKFESVGQILSQYCQVGTKGAQELREEFFQEMGMTKLAHRKLINRWVAANA